MTRRNEPKCQTEHVQKLPFKNATKAKTKVISYTRKQKPINLS